MNAVTLSDSGSLARLTGIPATALAASLQTVRRGRCRAGPIVWEIARLAHGPGVVDDTDAEHLRQHGDRL
jgi:hypothetical protein